MVNAELSGFVEITLVFEGEEFDLSEVPFSGSYHSDPGAAYDYRGEPGHSPETEVTTFPDWSAQELIEILEEYYPDEVPCGMADRGDELIATLGDLIYEKVADDADEYVVD